MMCVEHVSLGHKMMDDERQHKRGVYCVRVALAIQRVCKFQHLSQVCAGRHRCKQATEAAGRQEEEELTEKWWL